MSSVGITSQFQQSQNRKQFRKRVDHKKTVAKAAETILFSLFLTFLTFPESGLESESYPFGTCTTLYDLSSTSSSTLFDRRLQQSSNPLSLVLLASSLLWLKMKLKLIDNFNYFEFLFKNEYNLGSQQPITLINIQALAVSQNKAAAVGHEKKHSCRA